MNPEQFLRQIAKQAPAPVYLFLGPEAYQRDQCRKALIARVLAEADRESGFTRHDLEETELGAVLDDACSFSLFASQRLIWVASAETALPRRMTADDSEDAQSTGAALAAYVRSPTPGTVLVFESSRFGFEGDEKPKLERVQKFYGAISEQVEFRPFVLESTRRLALELARDAGLKLGTGELGLLVDSLGGDALRVANEIEKLRLYVGTERKVSADDIAALTPNAQSTTIFALVGALGRGDRKRSLDSLDTLFREGEYLPLALTFLATQFRLALVAHEADLRNPQQILAYCAKNGIRMWRDRAEQVGQTVSAFSRERLRAAIEKVYATDKALRDTRPDDRVVMEELVLSLTK